MSKDLCFASNHNSQSSASSCLQTQQRPLQPCLIIDNMPRGMPLSSLIDLLNRNKFIKFSKCEILPQSQWVSTVPNPSSDEPTHYSVLLSFNSKAELITAAQEFVIKQAIRIGMTVLKMRILQERSCFDEGSGCSIIIKGLAQTVAEQSLIMEIGSIMKANLVYRRELIKWQVFQKFKSEKQKKDKDFNEAKRREQTNREVSRQQFALHSYYILGCLMIRKDMKSLGAAVIDMNCKEAADELIKALNGKQLLNFQSPLTVEKYTQEALKSLYAQASLPELQEALRKVKADVAQSRENCSLYMTDIPHFFTQGDLYRLFSNYGGIQCLKLKKNRTQIITLHKNDILNSAKITFSDADEAKEALDTLNGQVLCANTKPVRIAFFNPENVFNGVQRGLDRNQLIENSHYRVLFIQGIHQKLSKDEVMRICSKYGQVDLVTLKQQELQSGEKVSKRQAIVQFATKEAAGAALKGLILDESLGQASKLFLDFYKSHESRIQVQELEKIKTQLKQRQMIPKDDFLIRRHIEKALIKANDLCRKESLAGGEENSKPNAEDGPVNESREEDDFEISEVTMSSANNNQSREDGSWKYVPQWPFREMPIKPLCKPDEFECPNYIIRKIVPALTFPKQASTRSDQMQDQQRPRQIHQFSSRTERGNGQYTSMRKVDDSQKQRYSSKKRDSIGIGIWKNLQESKKLDKRHQKSNWNKNGKQEMVFVPKNARVERESQEPMANTIGHTNSGLPNPQFNTMGHLQYQTFDSSWRRLSQTRNEAPENLQNTFYRATSKHDSKRNHSQVSQNQNRTELGPKAKQEPKRDASQVSERFAKFVSQVDEGCGGNNKSKERSKRRDSKSPAHFYTANYIEYLHKSPHDSLSPNAREPFQLTKKDPDLKMKNKLEVVVESQPSLGNVRESAADMLSPNRLESPKFKKVLSSHFIEQQKLYHFKSDEKPKHILGKVPHVLSCGVIKGLGASAGGSDPLNNPRKNKDVVVSGFNPGSPLTFGGSDNQNQKAAFLNKSDNKLNHRAKAMLRSPENSNSLHNHEMMIKEQEDFTDVVQMYKSSIGSGGSQNSAGFKKSPFMAQLNQPHMTAFEAQHNKVTKSQEKRHERFREWNWDVVSETTSNRTGRASVAKRSERSRQKSEEGEQEDN